MRREETTCDGEKHYNVDTQPNEWCASPQRGRYRGRTTKTKDSRDNVSDRQWRKCGHSWQEERLQTISIEREVDGSVQEDVDIDLSVYVKQE